MRNRNATLPKISHGRLRELLTYNPCSGLFYWKVDRPKAKAGARAGAVSSKKRYYIGVDLRVYQVSRLAWFYSYGTWPEVIDHINGDSLNDSIWNLANGSQKDNLRNPISRAKVSEARRRTIAAMKGAM